LRSGAGNIGFSGKRVIEQYTGHSVSKDFQTTTWLTKNGHADRGVPLGELKHSINNIIS
jgi:acetyl-CoA carboxylase beta subunit